MPLTLAQLERHLFAAAYEFLIRDFADQAGKKGGEFCAPRAVVRMIVRIAEPREKMSIYDPCVGSGGMLVLAKEYLDEHGLDPKNIELCGQESNGSVWAICKMNMLLHGIRTADIRNDDTLPSPQHVEGGELQRFDRVLGNPPFSQNYDRQSVTFPERFRWGWCPEGGKKADLMFVQHMLSVLRPRGMAVTVMPHGVLFRGGDEKKIRTAMLNQGLVDAVIGLGPNLFYGTGIPACILVLRARGRGARLRGAHRGGCGSFATARGAPPNPADLIVALNSRSTLEYRVFRARPGVRPATSRRRLASSMAPPRSGCSRALTPVYNWSDRTFVRSQR